MSDNKREQERTELYRTIWALANELRGSVDGWDFKQYVLGMLFYRYVGYEVSIKSYPETVEIYYKGELISTHTRLVGKNLFSYHLDHYMPLLRQRPRVIFDAAPLKQNIPPEVLEELKAQKKHDYVINRALQTSFIDICILL